MRWRVRLRPLSDGPFANRSFRTVDLRGAWESGQRIPLPDSPRLDIRGIVLVDSAMCSDATESLLLGFPGLE